jgi:hypothetical protein
VTEPFDSSTAGAPSTKTLARTIVTALAVAGAILVAVVLPAEYGVDPLGTGAALGLTAIADPAGGAEVETVLAGERLVPSAAGPIAHYGRGYNVDARRLVIGPYEYVEYKYRLEAGATMVYSWNADADLLHDFHADPDGTPAPDPVSFDTRDRLQASGVLTAPFAGIHGWYWENPGAETVTVSLVTAGFYSSAVEMRANRQRWTREVKPSALPDREAGQAQ